MKTISSFFSVILVALLLEPGVMAQVYQTVDEQGNPVFTDTPSPGSVEVELHKENIADAPPPSNHSAEVSPKSQPEQGAQPPKTGKGQVAKKITRDELPEFMKECQRQREENIAPLRTQAIEDCVAKQNSSRAHCERYNRTFGDRRQRTADGITPGMFWELPVCEQAVAAERYLKNNPDSESYNSP
jgi:hypothetical protein